MMHENTLDERRRALEEEYFRADNERKIAALRERSRAEHDREALAAMAGTAEPAVLDELLALHVEPSTLAAFALVPLVEVAWANGALEPGERRAILRDVDTARLPEGSAAREALEGWLEERPAASVMDVWVDYTKAVAAQLAPEVLSHVRAETMVRVRAVAEAAGGLLGVHRVSDEEAAVIARVEAAFGGAGGTHS